MGSKKQPEGNSADKPVVMKPVSKPAEKSVVIKPVIKPVAAKPVAKPVEKTTAKPTTTPAITKSQLISLKWLPETFGSVEIFGKKLASNILKGDEDAGLFTQALVEAFKNSQQSKKEKHGYAQYITENLEKYANVAYFIAIRGWKEKYVISFTPESQMIGTWEGKFEVPPVDLGGSKITNCVYLEMTPSLMLKTMKGKLNIDTQFFSGDITATGSVKLTQMFYEWIQEFYKYIGQDSGKDEAN